MNRGVADRERAARYVTDTTPENQAATFRNQDRVWPVRVIRRGDVVRPLPPHARSLEDLTFEAGDMRLSVGDYMARRRTAGLLILKHGEIALERYGMGNRPESPLDEHVDSKVDDRDALPAPRSTTARSAAWTIAATAICRGCAARPTRRSRSATFCGCARA